MLSLFVEMKQFGAALMLIQRNDVIDRVIADANDKDLS